MKRVCSITLIIVMIMSIVSQKIVCNATLVIPADDNTHFYLLNHYNTEEWSEDDFLTVQNYNDYYDDLSGSQKTDIINKFVDITANNDKYSAIINDFIHPEYTAQGGFTITNMYAVPPIYNGNVVDFEDCEILIIGLQNGSTNPFAIYCFYSPTGDDFVISGNTVISSQPYILTYQPYNWYRDTSYDGTTHLYYAPGSAERISIDTLNSQYNCYGSTINVNVYDGCLFSTMPYLFTSNTLNGIDTDYSSYESYLNGVSYAIDRRTDDFKIAIGDESGSQGTLGMLSGSFQQMYGGNSLSDSTLLTLFQLNNYADQNRYNVYLNFNYSFDVSGVYNAIPLEYHADYYTSNGMYDSYQVGSSNYLAVDMSKAYSRMPVRYSQEGDAVDQLGDINATLSSTRPVNQLSYTPIEALDIISKAGLQMYSTYDKTRTDVLEYDTGNEFLNWGNSLVNDLRCWIFGKPYETSVSQSHGVSNTTAYCKLRVTTFLSMGDQTSSSIIYEYDFLNGTWSSTGSIDFDDGNEFDGYEYKNPIEDISNYNNGMQPSSYYNSGGYSNATGGSVGDITISVGASQMIVDMTSEEWMKHSPNFAELITIIKNGITSVNEDSGSVVMLLSESYDVFPTPIWTYLSLAIAVIASLSIIRYIRRG